MKGLFLGAFVALAGASSAGVWNLSADWSDSMNPNGVWSLLKDSSSPFTVNWPEWAPGTPQPAWAISPLPYGDHVPAWLKLKPGIAFGVDATPGTVLVHGAEDDRTGSHVTIARWTSPITGTVRIWGDIWSARHLGRPMDWALAVDGFTTSTGHHSGFGPDTSASPMAFWEGTGGVGALTVNVVPGTTIDLKIISGDPNLGDFFGIRYCISTGEPTPLILDVDLEDFIGAVENEPITVEIIRGDGEVIQQQEVPLNSEGPAVMMVCLEGTYQVCVKARHWLRKCTTETITEGGSNTISMSLINGDIDGSNMIDSDDFDQLVAQFGNAGGSADLDGSESIDSDDFDILVKNFGLQGD